MHSRRIGCPDNGFCIDLMFEPSDVVAYSSRQKLNCLRQIANVCTQLLWSPLVERSAIKLNLATDGRPNADKKFSKRRLSRSTWTHDAKRPSLGESEGGFLNHELRAVRRCRTSRFDGQPRS